MKSFTLEFIDMVGKKVTLRDKGEYYHGVIVGWRFYHGIFGGTRMDKDGLYFIVDGDRIKVSSSTLIEFDD